MPVTYQAVKDATIALLSDSSHDHDIKANYGQPPASPKYDADTKLATVSINVYVRRSMTKSTNAAMRAIPGMSWHAVGALDMADPDTIGAFLKLMCAHADVTIPFGEPT